MRLGRTEEEIEDHLRRSLAEIGESMESLEALKEEANDQPNPYLAFVKRQYAHEFE